MNPGILIHEPEGHCNQSGSRQHKNHASNLNRRQFFKSLHFVKGVKNKFKGVTAVAVEEAAIILVAEGSEQGRNLEIPAQLRFRPQEERVWLLQEHGTCDACLACHRGREETG